MTGSNRIMSVGILAAGFLFYRSVSIRSLSLNHQKLSPPFDFSTSLLIRRPTAVIAVGQMNPPPVTKAAGKRQKDYARKMKDRFNRIRPGGWRRHSVSTAEISKVGELLAVTTGAGDKFIFTNIR